LAGFDLDLSMAICLSLQVSDSIMCCRWHEPRDWRSEGGTQEPVLEIAQQQRSVESDLPVDCCAARSIMPPLCSVVDAPQAHEVKQMRSNLVALYGDARSSYDPRGFSRKGCRNTCSAGRLLKTVEKSSQRRRHQRSSSGEGAPSPDPPLLPLDSPLPKSKLNRVFASAVVRQFKNCDNASI
jgi:hypothetical protein